MTVLINIDFKQLHPRAKMPQYATSGAAGADLCAVMEDGYKGAELPPGSWTLIQCGFAVSLPEGFEMQVRPRSGLALKHGVTVLNAPGTIDSDYRGEICVMLINLSTVPFLINEGDRIAQMIIAPVVQANFKSVAELDETVRGAGAFGSTGVK